MSIQDRQRPTCLLCSIFRKGDYAFVDKSAIFRLAAKHSITERYSKLLPRKQEAQRVTEVHQNTLRASQKCG